MKKIFNIVKNLILIALKIIAMPFAVVMNILLYVVIILFGIVFLIEKLPLVLSIVKSIKTNIVNKI